MNQEITDNLGTFQIQSWGDVFGIIIMAVIMSPMIIAVWYNNKDKKKEAPDA